MDDELAQPGVELVRVAKRRQVPPGADEAILDGVARELGIPEDQPSRSVQPRDGRAGKRGEGVMIALPCREDQQGVQQRRVETFTTLPELTRRARYA